MYRSAIVLMLVLLTDSYLLAQDTYDVSLYAMREDVTTASVSFTESGDSNWFDSGDFSYTSTATMDGSWFGFSWGPLQTRFAMGSADGDFVFLKSMSFGDMLIGGAFALVDGTSSRSFVAGSSSDVPSTAEASSTVDASPSADASPSSEGSTNTSDVADNGGEEDTVEPVADAATETEPAVQVDASDITQQDAADVAAAVQSLVDGN